MLGREEPRALASFIPGPVLGLTIDNSGKAVPAPPVPVAPGGARVTPGGARERSAGGGDPGPARSAAPPKAMR
eukprot:14546201-Alexandrium_andersonii.AAC.1